MSRAPIKSLKRALRQGADAQASETQALDARAAALSLVHRSVKMKHDRLAILRLVDAVRLDARVDEALWDYCQAVASSMADPAQLWTLQTLRRNVAHHAAGGSGPGPPGRPAADKQGSFESNNRRQK
jgi:hypothetical protein